MSLQIGSKTTRRSSRFIRLLRRAGLVLIFGPALVATACGTSSPTGTPGAQTTPTSSATATPVPSTAWRLVSGPITASRASALTATSTLSPSDAWAVGQSYVDSVNVQEQSLIERWDGGAWRVVANLGLDHLNGVVA